MPIQTTYRHGRAVRRPKRRLRRGGTWLGVVVLTCLYVAYIAWRPISYTVDLSVKQPQVGQSEVMWPATGQAALGVMGQGVVDVSPNEHKAPIASITKIVTAMAVLEKHPIKPGEDGKTITFSTVDVTTYQDVVSKGGLAIAVTPGQRMTERKLLEAMLITSANNMAIMLSQRFFGSEQAYATYANNMLKRHGLKHTHITSASGLAADTTSTPSDLIRIAEIAMQSPVIAEITAMNELSMPGYPAFRNNSHPVGVSDRLHGIKVGFIEEAGACLLFWIDPAGDNPTDTKIYGVILGQPDFGQLRTQLNIFAEQTVPQNFAHTTLVSAGKVVATFKAKNFTAMSAIAKDDIVLPVWRGRPISLKLSETITAPSLEIQTGSASKKYTLSPDNFATPSLFWRLLHPV